MPPRKNVQKPKSRKVTKSANSDDEENQQEQIPKSNNNTNTNVTNNNENNNFEDHKSAEKRSVSGSAQKAPSQCDSVNNTAPTQNNENNDNSGIIANDDNEDIVNLKKDKVMLHAKNAKAQSDIFSLQDRAIRLQKENDILSKVLSPLAGNLSKEPAILISEEEFAKYQKIRALGHSEFATVAEVVYNDSGNKDDKNEINAFVEDANQKANHQNKCIRYARKTLISKKYELNEFKSFVKENKALLNMRHPCVAAVYGFSHPTNDKAPSFFLEYLPYKLNEQLISSMTATRKALVVTEIALGMRYVHSLGYLHRELKPANILLTDTYHVKICDFQFTSLDTIEDQLAKGVGASQFMSPQLLAEETYTNKVDVYAFGMLLHYVVCGTYPKLSVKDRAIGKPIEIPGVFQSFVGDIISHCLAFEESKRPSFDEILKTFKKNNYEIVDGMDPAFVIERVNFVEAFEKTQIQ